MCQKKEWSKSALRMVVKVFTHILSPSMKARIHTMRHFDTNVNPESVNLDQNSNSLVIHWAGHVKSRYNQNWLKTRNLSDESVRDLRKHIHLSHTKPWNGKEIKERLQKFKHTDFLKNDKVLHDFLMSVCENGIALLVDGPVESISTVLEEIGRRIGLIQPTHFGNKYEVTTKPEAGNMAYANGEALPYHTDFPSLSQPPELQMLHMVQPAEEGGLSTFVDGFKMAELMEKEQPELYKILTSTLVEYIEEGFDIHTGQDGQPFKFEFDMVARHKVFSLNDMETVKKVQFGNAMRSWYFDCEPKDVQKVYDALKMFTDYCYQPKNQLIFPLKKGETVLWANTRLLHGRTAYKSAPNQERMVIGCYFMWDIVKSRIRMLRDRLELPQNQLSV
uniref:TauD/TfdA-like domain-containing protein n=1 Tax=Ditylenchus dipsaci TaxID=166011 RepID=A0A915E8J3_9BILA